jgi:DNA repair exonuclease SbcCD ATPase subunit
VTKHITDLLGVDHEGFMVSVFARQDELDALAGKIGSERVVTVLRLMGVEQADKALRDIRKQANDARRELDVLRAGVPDVPALVASLDQSKAECTAQRKALTQAQARQQQAQVRVDALREQQAALGPAREAYSAWQARENEARMAVWLCDDSLGTAQARASTPVPEVAPPTLADVPVVDITAIEQARAEVDALRERYAVANSNMGRLQDDIAHLGDTECPTCHRAFDNAADIEKLREERTQQLAEAIAEVASTKAVGSIAREALDGLQRRLEEGRAIIAANAEAQRAYERALEQQAQAQATRDQAQADVQRIEQELAEAQAALASLQAEQPPDPSSTATKIESDLYEAQATLSQHASAVAGAYGGIAVTEADIARIERDIAAARAREAQANECEQRVVTLDTTATEMAKMKERLIAGIVPALEQRASAIVSELTDGKHQELHLSADYEMQYVSETGELRSFANLSGGAQRVFALALRLAIADVRAGRVPFLVLDEILESLDDERQGLAWEAIEHLAARYSQVLVVSHTTFIKDRAPNVLAL